MRDEILEQIDKLKMMVMLDNTPPKKTDLELYEEWIEEMQGRKWFPMSPLEPFYPKKYAEYSSTRALVDDLYYKKFGDKRDYHKNKLEIRKMIAEIVAMTMYVQENL